MYPIDFKQKDGELTYYPPLSAINALSNQGFLLSDCLHNPFFFPFDCFKGATVFPVYLPCFKHFVVGVQDGVGEQFFELLRIKRVDRDDCFRRDAGDKTL